MTKNHSYDNNNNENDNKDNNNEVITMIQITNKNEKIIVLIIKTIIATLTKKERIT